MKKILLPLVALMLSMVACQKENEGILTLEVEEYNTDAKLHLNDDNFAVWDNGDEVQVNGTDYTVSVSGTTASISDVEEAANYTAIYPAAWANTTGTTITYPATQTYRANGIDAPMAAYSDGGNLSFKNLGSLLAVNVSGVTKVQKIEVIADGTTAINGTATLDFSGDRPALGTLTSGTNTTTLNCNGATVPAEGKTFYIALPPVTANLTIKVYDDYFCYSRSQEHTNAPSYEASHGYNVPFDASEISSPEQYAPLSTQIWYTATSQISVNSQLTNVLGNPIDHTFSDGKGVLTFAGNVTSIPASAFHFTSFTTVTLPYSVTSIGESAFDICRQLTSIDMPGVTSIGPYAFESCYALTSISLYNVTTLGARSFQACENLSSVILPINDLESYSGFGVFAGCYNLTDCYYYRNEPDPNLDPGGMNARGTLHVPATSTYAWSPIWWSEGTVVRDL